MSDINQSIQKTLVHEGGFQNNRNDHANWTGGKIGVGALVGTKYGITALDMPGVDIKNITVEQAVAYYKEHYVKPYYVQISDQLVLDKVFDLGVLFGIATVVKHLQRAILVTPMDGVFGPATLAVLNSIRPSQVIERFQKVMVQYAYDVVAVHPEDQEDLQGWLNRIYS